MKKRLFIVAAALSLFMSSCTTSESSYINNNDLVTISVEESQNYTVNSENPLNVVRGEDAIFKITFNGDYNYKSSSNGTYDTANGNFTVSNVQFSQTIYIESVEMVTVTIVVNEESHFTINSQNPLKIEKGLDAYFDIEFEEGYAFESSTVGEYEDGRFIIRNVQNSISASIYTRMKDIVYIRLFANPLLGEIRINGNITTEYRGYLNDVVSIEAIALGGKKFICWSIDDYISGKMPYLFERFFDFKLVDDINLYANFWDNYDNTIIYSGNGGATICGDDSIYYPHTKANHIRLNTIQGSKAFNRKGYLLDSWNTKADGSGLRIGLGSRVKIPNESIPLTLYAKWIKETDYDYFNFELNDDESYSITNCMSNEETIVIPEKYNDLPITTIKSNSFNNLPFKTIYFPQFLKVVESKSLVGCNNFDNLHFFDYLNTIPNDFFDNKKPSFVHINANTDPCYIGSYQNLFVRKTDLLTELNDEKIVIIGNSNVLYSIDGSMISNHFGKDVLCYGVQAGIGVAWELACLRYYCNNANNIVIFAVEFDAINIGYFSEHKFYAAEGNYDLLLTIDFNELNYLNFFGAYTRFKEFKTRAKITPYSNNDNICDDYGCLKLNIEPYREDGWTASIVNVNMDFYKEAGFKWVENYCSSFINSKFYMSVCSFNRNCISTEKQDEFYGEYEQSIIDNISYKVISKQSDYAFSGSAFHNDNYHLIYSFAVERTNILINDLSPFIY